MTKKKTHEGLFSDCIHTRKTYLPPSIQYALIESEDSISNTSTIEVVIGDPAGTPQVNDWQDRTNTQFWDF